MSLPLIDGQQVMARLCLASLVRAAHLAQCIHGPVVVHTPTPNPCCLSHVEASSVVDMMYENELIRESTSDSLLSSVFIITAISTYDQIYHIYVHIRLLSTHLPEASSSPPLYTTWIQVELLDTRLG